MSEQVFLRGKVKEFHKKENEMIEDYFKRFYKFKEENFKYVDNGEDLLENFNYDFYKQAVYCNYLIYYVIEEESFEEIFEATRIEGGDVRFYLSYYNGCCSFSEALEKALNNLENQFCE